MSVDLDSKSHCPTAQRCEDCQATTGLDIATASTPMGVFCLTLCRRCFEKGRPSKLSVVTAFNRVAEHCEHLGIDLDRMADILDAERGEA